MIDLRSDRTTNRRRKTVQEDYQEDWDSGSTVRRTRTGTSQNKRSASGRNGSTAARSGKANTGNQGRTDQRRDRATDGGGDRSPRGREDRPSQRGRGKKRKKKKSGFRKFVATILVLVLLLAAGLYCLVGYAYSKMKYEEIPALAKEAMQEDGVVNILLIGNDSRENGEDGRSDAMILLSISKKTKKIYMTSLLRDMYVEIPGHDGNRLNAAYAYGGAELLMETIEQNLGIEINRYVMVNFEAFANLVDAVGGVDLELTNEEVVWVNGYLWEYNILLGRPEGTDYFDTSLSGMIHLNGAQALAFTRNRYVGTDFGRTERQRKVLTAVIKKLPKAAVTHPGKLIDGLMPNLTTNLTKGECYRLSLMAGRFLTYDIVPASIPMEGTYHDATIRKMAVLEVDFEANRRYLMENIYGEK